MGLPTLRLTAATDVIDYLGADICQSGTEASTILRRIAKARNFMQLLLRMGFYFSRMSPIAVQALYRTFVRPLYEYGSALIPYTPEVFKALDKLDSAFFRHVIAQKSLHMSPKGLPRSRALFRIEPPILRESIAENA